MVRCALHRGEPGALVLHAGHGSPFRLVFPRPRPVLERRSVLVAIYGGAWLLYLLFLAASALGTPTPAALLGLHWRATYVVGVTYFVFIFAAVSWGLRAQLDAHERRQLRWVVWGVGIGYVPWLAVFAASGFVDISARSYIPVVGLLLLAIPTSVSIAIVRERLFDIDLIVNRTLVYGSLSAILAALYAASVALSQRIIAAVTGQQSDLSIVVATLVIVAAFTPIKDFLQRAMDRRFRGPPPSLGLLHSFGEQVRVRVVAVDPPQITRRFLDVAVQSIEASGGVAYLGPDEKRRQVATVGAIPAEPTLEFALAGRSGEQVGVIVFGPRRDGRPYREPEIAAVRACAMHVGDAIETDLALHQEPAR